MNTPNDELIEQLLNENSLMKQKYEQLLKEYEKLKIKYKNVCDKYQEQDQDFNKVQLIKSSEDIDLDEIIIKKFASEKQKQTPKQSETKQNQFQQTSIQIDKDITLTRLRESSLHSSRCSITQKQFPLIQGCFILQKKAGTPLKPKPSLSQQLQFVYPAELLKTQKHAIQMLLKYIFTQPDIQMVQDDQFNSRKNQIVYGTPYEDFCYAIQDSKWANKKDLPEIIKLMGTLKKKYYHVLVKPEIVDQQQSEKKIKKQKVKEEVELVQEVNTFLSEDIKIEKTQQAKQNNSNQAQQPKIQNQQQQPNFFFQTQVIFCFISPFPLKSFFQDLHRTIQQQLKYSQFAINSSEHQSYETPMLKGQKYKIMGSIMKRIYQEEYRVNKFPLQHQFLTGMNKIQLDIPNVNKYREQQDQFLNHVLNRYPNVQICRLLHYVLTQKCILLEVAEKKYLNELLQAIRILIRPFLWLFTIIYEYSDFFEPFMSSPLPIIIGKVYEKSETNDKEAENQRRQSVDYSDFILIKMGQDEKLREKQLFYQSIKKMKQTWDKKDKNKDRASYIHQYVNNLKTFIEKGILNSEPTDFHIQFIDTQMVSYYKQMKQQT